MDFQILPNWGKRLGLFIFLISFLLVGGDSFMDGYKGAPSGTHHFVKDFLGNTLYSFFDVLPLTGLLIYMFSKEKVEDSSRGKRNFNHEGLQKILMDNDSVTDEPPLVEPHLFKKIVIALKIIYKNCLNRYRYVFQVNKRHPLFIENDIGSLLSSLKKINPI